MNWAWASSLDYIWRSPTFPMWLTLAAAGFFGLIVLITLLRAEKSVANGALTVITLLAIGIAVAATIRGFGPGGQGTVSAQTRNVQPVRAGLPQLSCIDDLAGEAVLSACEKVLFGSAESSAAAVAYAASLITQLTDAGDAAAVKNPSSEFLALRRAVERDRYGLMAYVLTARDHCTPQGCPVFRSLGDSRQIAVNMDDHVYENLITRYTSSWNAPPQAQVAGGTGMGAGLIAGMPPSMPTGKPTNAEFPTSASTPAVSIMAPEPGPGAKPPAAVRAPAPSPAPAAAAAAPPPAAPKKQAAAKRAPVSIAPAAPAPAAAAAPAADD